MGSGPRQRDNVQGEVRLNGLKKAKKMPKMAQQHTPCVRPRSVKPTLVCQLAKKPYYSRCPSVKTYPWLVNARGSGQIRVDPGVVDDFFKDIQKELASLVSEPILDTNNESHLFISYVGGKHLLAKTLLPRLEDIPHTCTAWPFVGMGGVFLRRPERARSDVINDYNREVALRRI